MLINLKFRFLFSLVLAFTILISSFNSQPINAIVKPVDINSQPINAIVKPVDIKIEPSNSMKISRGKLITNFIDDIVRVLSKTTNNSLILKLVPFLITIGITLIILAVIVAVLYIVWEILKLFLRFFYGD